MLKIVVLNRDCSPVKKTSECRRKTKARGNKPMQQRGEMNGLMNQMKQNNFVNKTVIK